LAQGERGWSISAWLYMWQYLEHRPAAGDQAAICQDFVI
jgi:hypothetical protein